MDTVTPREGYGVLDTETLMLLGQLPDDAPLPMRPVITTITLAELSAGPLAAATDAERAARQAHVQQAEADFEPLIFDSAAARAFGRVAAALRASGKKSIARGPNALIAAIALANRLPVYTCNPKDFEGIEGLDVVAAPVPRTQ